MKIEVLGPGCPRCRDTEENVKKALSELNKQAEVVKVTDMDAIIGRGVMRTPALVIDGNIVMQGRIPTVEQVKQFIQ